MRINDIQIDGFGVWTGLELKDLSGKLTVIYGPNETGKTTLMEFVRATLFGMDETRRERYLPPVHGGRSGGTLTVGSKQAQYRLGRFFSENSTGEFREELKITDSGGRRQNDRTLDVLLSGIDEPTLNNVFVVGLREIQELATLNDTEAAEQLYALAGGLDRVALLEVRKELHNSRNRLLTPGNRDSRIHQLLDRRRQIKSRINELSEMSRRWSRKSTDSDEINTHIEEAKRELEKLKQESQEHELAMNVREPWRHRAEIDQRLSQLAALPHVSFATMDELNEIKEQEKKYALREQELKKKCDEARRQAEKQSETVGLLDQRSRVQSLLEQESWLHRIQPQMMRFEKEIKEFESKLHVKHSALGIIGGELDDLTDTSSSASLLSSLTEPARELREAKRRLASAKRDASENREQQQAAVASVEKALNTRGETDLNTAVENAEYQVELLRRRIQVDERLQQVERQRGQLDDEGNDWLERHVLTDQQIWMVGTLFVVGAVMLLSALLGWTGTLGLVGETRWLLAILGMGCIVATAIAKASIERTAEEHFDDCRKQLALVDKQISQASEERDQLDEVLPRGHGPYAVQLKSAEGDLDTLQQLVPLDMKRRSGRPSGEGKDQASSATNRYKRARNRWRDALLAASLPDTMNPDELDKMSLEVQKADEIRRQLLAKQRELEEKQTEVEAFKDQIDRVLIEFDLDIDEDEPLALLQKVRKELSEQEQRARRRKTARRESQRLKRSYDKCGQSLARSRRRRRSLLAKAGVADEEQLKRLVDEASQTQQLRQERDQLGEQISASIGLQYDEPQITTLLQGTGDADVERRLEKLWDRQQACEARLNRLYEQSGERLAETEQARDDRRMAIAQLELGCIEHQLQSAVRRWQTVGMTSRLLDSVCESYESERQPETLRDASQLFEQMTGGRYTRIWTPLEHDVLRVEDHTGQTLGVESLSTGTREQLFLSLRLAVAQMFGQGGRRIPMLLDDVLVNFDADRTKTAAQVLRDYCKSGQQLILFTCHEHIMKIFRSLRADVITLPGHAELVELEVEKDEELEAEVEVEEKPRRKKRRRRKKIARPVEIAEPVVEPEAEVEAAKDEAVAEPAIEEPVVEPQPIAEIPPEPVKPPIAPPIPEVTQVAPHQTNSASDYQIWDDYATWHSESLDEVVAPAAHDAWESAADRSEANGQYARRHETGATDLSDLLVVHQAHGVPAWHVTEQQRPEAVSAHPRSDHERRPEP